ncbi:SagB family peptide dehydrogenase [Streptoalloteichus hindustanus]|uniref:SagB-type dehydrogenase domain-containing protein n=1 Tax=Streptoalloteichus hindustanus TaxID=2017 RepID=A0A1M4ZHQ1_STRHI|nr:SagB family peptide dehydrogenase [Streptoalloteichus hindustanus]SHF17337.1 SagB-type dehydrogenase domain-containing protein [Streptoalloteichus hindustanus]
MDAPVSAHSLCRSRAPYRVEVGGVLTPSGIERGRRVLTVLSPDSWEIRPTGDPVDASFPETLVAPALCDAHVHLHPFVDLAEYVTYGVTRIRDLGSLVGAGEKLPTASGCADPVPEIVLGGPLFDRPGKQRLLIAAPWSDAADLPALFDAAVARGARWIKLYARFPAELYDTAVALAHARGLRVALHPGPGDYSAAVRAGVDELEHLVCLTPAGDGVHGTHAVHRRWADRRDQDTWPCLPPGTAVCPTLIVNHHLVAEAERGWSFPGHDPTMVRFWRELTVVSRPWTEEELAAGRAAVARMAAAIPELDRAGVRWVIGSDTPNPGVRPGRSLWEEMNLLVAAGLDRMAVYRAAAVARGLGETGADSLVLLPLSTFDSPVFPVEPPTAVLLRGCLFVANRETEAVMTTRYRRNPWLLVEWDDGDRVVVVNSRSQRRFRIEPELLWLLNQISKTRAPEELDLPGYSADQLAGLLTRLAEAGIVQPVNSVNGESPADRNEWTACELAVHAQASRGGKPKMKLRDIPSARLNHAEATRTIPLSSPSPPSRPLAEVLRARRSIRDFAPAPLLLDELSAFLDRAARVEGWLGRDEWQTTRRPSASGGGRHSIELYLVVRNVDGLEPGAYHYDPFAHALEQLQPWSSELDDLQHRLLCRAMMVEKPPQVSFYLASYFRRVQCKYGGMTLSVIYRDTGCLIQTFYLVATDLGLARCATATIEAEPTPSFLGAYRDSFIHTANFALGLPASEEPSNPDFRPLTNGTATGEERR